MSRVQPRSNEEVAAVLPGFAEFAARGLPTSYRVLAHRPEILEAFNPLFAAIMVGGEVERGLKQMLVHMVSRVTGCRYCQAHTAQFGVEAADVPAEKMRHLWDFETAPGFSDAERAALRLARDSALIPNAVTDEHFTALRGHFSDPQIVEIVAALSLFGFLNRFNDTLANELEAGSIAWAGEHLAPIGWELGKHAPAESAADAEALRPEKA